MRDVRDQRSGSSDGRVRRGLPSGGAWKARIDADDVRYGADFGAAQPTTVTVASAARDNLPFTGSIALAPYSVVILTH